jgi:hypothetical protein
MIIKATEFMVLWPFFVAGLVRVQRQKKTNISIKGKKKE